MVYSARILWITALVFSFTGYSKAHAASQRLNHVVSLCKQCHGQSLEGNRVIGAPTIAGMPAWYIESQIGKMKKDIRGKHPKDIGGMRMRPLMRALTRPQDITDVSALVESMPKVKVATTIEGDVERGKERYQLCQSCHGENAQGIKEVSAPPLTITDDWYLLTQLKHFKAKVRGGDAAADSIGSQMYAIAITLEDEQTMKDILAYINTKR